jgi:autotransporter-associated beta strand protein
VQNGSIGAILGGSGALTKSTTGSVTLSGANTYSGGTTINAGTLSVAADNNLGAPAGNVSFGGNGTLGVTGSFASARNINIANGVSATLSNSGVNTFSGAVASNSGNLTKAGAGAVTLSGVLSGTNGYNVTGGTLALTNTANTVTGAVSVTGGSTLQLAGSGAAGGATGDVTLDGGTLSNTDSVNGNAFLASTRAINIGAGGGTINVPAASGTALVYSGSILGPGNTVTKTGTGTLRNTSPVSNTFSKLVVTGGLWQSNSDAGFGAVPGAPLADQITLNGGGISANNGAGGVILNANRGITLAGNGTIDVANALTYAGTISGTGPLVINGGNAGTIVQIGGNNTYSGGTTIRSTPTRAPSRSPATAPSARAR